MHAEEVAPPAPLQIETPYEGPHEGPPTNVITQEEDEDEKVDGPARNTRSRSSTRSITQEFLAHTIDVMGNTFTARQAASRALPLQFLCDYASAILDAETGELLEYRHLMKRPKHRPIWGHSFGNEVGRLAQGMPGRVEGSDTIFFIRKSDIPHDRRRDTTYSRIVCDFRPNKEETHRTRITAGGDRINYPGDCGTPTADMITVKLLFNSIVSTDGAKFMSLDIKNFYLNTPMQRYEYLRMKLADFPEDVIAHYKLHEKVEPDGCLYVEVRKGMYGLPHAGLIAQQLLEKRLGKHGYYQSKITPGFWRHKWRPISFTLVVDDFGVKYVGKEHVDHLIGVLKGFYDISEDWEGEKYIGLTIDWDYAQRKVHVSMPGYVENALQRFQHPEPARDQHQPHPHTVPNYGTKVQYAKQADKSRPLTKEEKTYVQQIIGTFLYHARAVDSTMLMALSTLASTQANPTEDTLTKVKLFLDYAATHPDAIVTYSKSDMVLALHSDASYLSENNARSRAAGHFFLSSDTEDPENNGAVLTVSQIIKAVMSSAVCSRSRNGRDVYQRARGRANASHARGIGPQTAQNADANR